MVFSAYRFRVTDRDRRFDDHDRVRIDGENQFNHGLHSGGVKIISGAVVVGRCGDDEVDFFRKNVDRRHMVVLREQGGDGESDVAGAGNRNA